MYNLRDEKILTQPTKKPPESHLPSMIVGLSIRDCQFYGHSWQTVGTADVKRCTACGITGYCPGCTPVSPTTAAQPFYCTRHTPRHSDEASKPPSGRLRKKAIPMRFDPQTITVTDNKVRAYQIDALVALQDDGTLVGLAVHPVYDLGPGPMIPTAYEYTLTHIPSGVRLHRAPVPTEATARRWLELVAPLADLTQSHEGLRMRVAVARAQPLTECEDPNRSTETRLVSVSPTFALENVTPLIEWICYGMEYVGLPDEARPALDTLLATHADLAHKQSVSSHAIPS